VFPIRVSLTTEVLDEVEQAQVFLAALSQQLAALQQEQAKELGVSSDGRPARQP
jgi:hypothetical protein